MTYLESETGHERPLELYRFSFGGYFWRFTNGDQTFTAPDGETYVPEPLIRSGMSLSEEADAGSVTITLPPENQVAEYFTRTGVPARHIWLTVRRTHEGANAEIATVFVGVASEAVFKNGLAQITFAPMRSAMGRQIPVQLTNGLCSNTLYDQRCRANPDLFESVVTVTAIDGLTLAVTGIEAKEADYFSGGFIYSNGIFQYATIRKHDAPDTLHLLHNPGYLVGDTLSIYPGCDKKVTTCQNKFNNTTHFQGFSFFPKVDPFDGGVT